MKKLAVWALIASLTFTTACGPSKPRTVPTVVGTYPQQVPVVQQSQRDIEYQQWKQHNMSYTALGDDCDFDDWLERDTDCGFPAKTKTKTVYTKPKVPVYKATKPVTTTTTVTKTTVTRKDVVAPRAVYTVPKPTKPPVTPYVAPKPRVNSYGSSSFSSTRSSSTFTKSTSSTRSSSSSSRRR